MRHGSLGSALLLLAISLPARSAAADDCDGPPACCVTDPAAVTTLPTPVRLGMRVMRIEKIAEQDGNYSGELTLTHKWPASSPPSSCATPPSCGPTPSPSTPCAS